MRPNRALFILASTMAVGAALCVRLWPEVLDSEKPRPLELPAPSAAVAPGEVAPELKLQDISGTWHTLAGPSDMPTFVYFWASWCSPCLRALPELEASQAAFVASGVRFVSVAQDERSTAREVLASIPVSFPVLVAEGASVDPVRAMGSRDGLVPFSVLLDEKGTVLLQVSGEVDVASVLAILKSRGAAAL